MTVEHVITYTSPEEEGEDSFAVIGRKVPFPGVLTVEKEVLVEVPSLLETPVIIETPGMSVRIETLTPVSVISAVDEPEFEISELPEPEIPLFLELPDLKIHGMNGHSLSGFSESLQFSQDGFSEYRAVKPKQQVRETTAAVVSLR